MGIYGRQGIRGWIYGFMDMDIWIHEGVVWEYMAGRGYVWGSGEMNVADQLRI